MEDKFLQVMRAQAWQRAKAELQSVLVTFYGEKDSYFEVLDAHIEEFVKKVEDNGWAE